MPQVSKDRIQESRTDCQLLEIVQYSCEPENIPGGEIRTHCFPISRIFRMCAHQPAVEITRLVMVNGKTGEIEIPKVSSALPKGKLWRNVELYNEAN